MDDDFNTGAATAALFDLRKTLNGFIADQRLEGEGRSNTDALADHANARWWRTHCAAWWAHDGGRAWAGSPARYLCTSVAKALADPYRRSRSLSIAFMTIQSRSPRSCWQSWRGSM